jgi:aspartate 1-decarboxylase
LARQKRLLSQSGNRFTTYAIRGKDNSGVISVNGAAAHKAQVGDLLIIASYASYSEVEVKNYAPTLCYVDANNVLTQIKAAL